MEADKLDRLPGAVTLSNTLASFLSHDVRREDYSNGFVCPWTPQLLLKFSRNFDNTFQLLFPWPEVDHILSRSCSTDIYQSHSPLAIFSPSVRRHKLVSATPPTVSRDFHETVQLLFPGHEDDHILSRSCSTDFYQSYGPLTFFSQ